MAYKRRFIKLGMHPAKLWKQAVTGPSGLHFFRILYSQFRAIDARSRPPEAESGLPSNASRALYTAP